MAECLVGDFWKAKSGCFQFFGCHVPSPIQDFIISLNRNGPNQFPDAELLLADELQTDNLAGLIEVDEHKACLRTKRLGSCDLPRTQTQVCRGCLGIDFDHGRLIDGNHKSANFSSNIL